MSCIVSLPVIALSISLALIFCILYTSYQDPVGLSRTHCAIPNYIPSLSASVTDGICSYVWRTTILVTCLLRVPIIWVYNNRLFNAYATRMRVTDEISCRLCHLYMYFGEIAGLTLLTVFSSTDNFPVHRNSFALFVFCCQFSGFVEISVLRSIKCKNGRLARLYFRKSALLLIMWITIILSLSFYYIHSVSCLHTAYSIFGLMEHLFILSNIAFHYCDSELIGGYLTLSSSRIHLSKLDDLQIDCINENHTQGVKQQDQASLHTV